MIWQEFIHLKSFIWVAKTKSGVIFRFLQIRQWLCWAMPCFRAYHLFYMEYKGTNYELNDEEFQTKPKLMAETKLGNLKLEIGDKIHMIYDFGEEQEFEITLLSDEEMSRGSGRTYPKVSDGAGRGIIDDMSAEDLLDLIKKIDKTGKSDFIYAHKGEHLPWDYHNYQIDIDNCLLKGEIAKIKSAYENPVEDF